MIAAIFFEHLTPDCDYGPTAAIRSKIHTFDPIRKKYFGKTVQKKWPAKPPLKGFPMVTPVFSRPFFSLFFKGKLSQPFNEF